LKKKYCWNLKRFDVLNLSMKTAIQLFESDHYCGNFGNEPMFKRLVYNKQQTHSV